MPAWIWETIEIYKNTLVQVVELELHIQSQLFGNLSFLGQIDKYRFSIIDKVNNFSIQKRQGIHPVTAHSAGVT